jgi:hypothetical protein
MLEAILKLQNWARLAGFVTIFLSVIVCSFLYAISYPPLPSDGSVAKHNHSSTDAEQKSAGTDQRGTKAVPLAVEIVPPKDGTPEAKRYEKESLEKSSNERGLTIATWILAFATVILFVFAGVQVGLFYWQLRLIGETLAPAKEAAEAAKLNAEAVMAAEGAHLFPVLREDNLQKEVFRGVSWYENSGDDSDRVPTPQVTFCFKNYGKTPAVFESFMWGIEYFKDPSSLRTMHLEDRELIEIIGSNQETAEITLGMLGTFDRGMAKAVREYKGDLLFFGEAAFKDFFDRRFRCIWEYDGRGDGFRLVRHEERKDPDKKES